MYIHIWNVIYFERIEDELFSFLVHLDMQVQLKQTTKR